MKDEYIQCKYSKISDVILTVHRRYYVEIKCQLDATDEFLLQILLLAQHISGTTMPIIRSLRVLYRWLLPVVFGALVFKLSVRCGTEDYVSGLRAA
jgi:uncharacterized Fe-S radical SAM superfamily protein PflX